MKKTLLILMAIVAVMSSCKKDNWLDWRTQNEIWLQENAKLMKDSAGFCISESGLQYRILNPGNPTDVKPDDNKSVYVKYDGYLINGNRFDGGTTTLNVASVVPGFAEGLKMIRNFGEIEIWIPSELGYGNTGQGTEGSQSHIPPYSTLYFRIRLLGVF